MADNKEKKMTRFEKLTAIAKSTKESLIRSWNENGGCFIDKDKMQTTGLIAELSGLTSLLLFLIAFVEEKDIITDADRSVIREIHRKSFTKICTWIEEDGFTAEPLVSIKESKNIFRKDKTLGYVDTISWALSVSVLTRYLDRKGILTMDIGLLEKNYDLLTISLAALIKAQHDDGTWGFLSDKNAKKSLYFTFVANAAIADFFDYILGEIAYISLPEEATEEEIAAAIEKAKDDEILQHLAGKLKDCAVDLTDGSVEKTMEEVRRKIQDWLIFNCLPLMPELALCKDSMDKTKKERLGMWDVSGDIYQKYFNLYYVYYLIEMMVTSGSDNRMKELVGSDGKNEEGINRLKEYYFENDLMKKIDRDYYLSEKNVTSFWKSIMEQTIHSSRTEYMNASRTGKNYWDSIDGDKSSLKIFWEHSEHRIQDEVAGIGDSIGKCMDPCVIPMALRSNIMYSYYISEQSDMTVDRLFEIICDQRAEADTDKLFGGLWDSIKYSLIVTERSVEALVDYYDFLNKFDKSVASAKAVAVAQKSQIDILIEEKIADYLKSASARDVINEYISDVIGEQATVSDATQSKASFEDEIEKYLQTKKGEATVRKAVGITDINDLYNKIDKLSSSEMSMENVIGMLDVIISAAALDDVLASRLIEVCEVAKKTLLKKQINDVLKTDNGNDMQKAEAVQRELTKDMKELYKYVIEVYSGVDAEIRKSFKDIMKDLY